MGRVGHPLIWKIGNSIPDLCSQRIEEFLGETLHPKLLPILRRWWMNGSLALNLDTRLPPMNVTMYEHFEMSHRLERYYINERPFTILSNV